jgi:hypothetical protein
MRTVSWNRRSLFISSPSAPALQAGGWPRSKGNAQGSRQRCKRQPRRPNACLPGKDMRWAMHLGRVRCNLAMQESCLPALTGGAFSWRQERSCAAGSNSSLPEGSSTSDRAPLPIAWMAPPHLFSLNKARKSSNRKNARDIGDGCKGEHH